MGFVITSTYDSAAMAGDIANIAGDIWNVETGEMFTRGDSHAFSVVAPGGRKFIVTVTEVENENPGDYPPTCILTGEPGENPDDCTTHDHE